MGRTKLLCCLWILILVISIGAAAAQYAEPRPPGMIPGGQWQPGPWQPPPPPPPPEGYQRPAPAPAAIQSQPLPAPPGIVAAPESSRPGLPVQAPASGPSRGGQEPRGAAPPVGPAPPAEEVALPSQKIANQTAVVSGLDKITGRIITFEVAIDETVQFGALRVRPRACYTRPPTEAPNTDGFVEVDEITLQNDTKRIFTGWMFASSPGLHGVEHAIYDVWLIDCKKPAQTAAATNAPNVSAQSATPAQRR
jgi:hypothetical protein